MFPVDPECGSDVSDPSLPAGAGIPPAAAAGGSKRGGGTCRYRGRRGGGGVSRRSPAGSSSTSTPVSAVAAAGAPKRGRRRAGASASSAVSTASSTTSSAQGRKRKHRKKTGTDVQDEDAPDAEDADAGNRAKEAFEEELERRQETYRRSGFKHAIYVQTPEDPEKLHEYKVVEKGTPGARTSGRLFQMWRVSGQVGAVMEAPSSRPDIAQSMKYMSTTQASAILTGQSKSGVAEYWASVENWVLEHLGDVLNSDPQDPIGRYVAEIKRWERVAKMDPEHDEDAIVSEMAKEIMAMPEQIVNLLFEACLTPRSEKLRGGVIPGLARERLDSDGPGCQIGYPTLVHFDQAINAVHRLLELPSPTVSVCVLFVLCGVRPFLTRGCESGFPDPEDIQKERREETSDEASRLHLL